MGHCVYVSARKSAKTHYNESAKIKIKIEVHILTDYQNNDKQPRKTARQGTKSDKLTALLVKGILPLIIVASGVLGGWYIYKTRPKAKKIEPEKIRALVKVMPLRRSNEQITLHEKGTVIPVHKINLQARVSGQIIKINPEFTIGGLLNKGEEILQIDPADYKLAVQQARQQLIKAQANLKLEMGRQAVALHEWELLTRDNTVTDSNQNSKRTNSIDRELALRKPQLHQAEAAVTSAQTTLEQTQLNLQRTTLYAPFNAIVYSKNTDVGSQVMPQQNLGVLVNTDEYWVKVPLAVDKLKWITVPVNCHQKGSMACILYNKSNKQRHCQRYGQVVRLLGDMQPNGRMAMVLIAVKDPLDISKPETGHTPLLVNDYVDVDIQGQELKGVFKIPRSALHQNNEIWLVGKDNTLNIRPVEVLWSDLKNAIINGNIKQDDKLIITDIPAPVNGMAIQIQDTNAIK